MKNNIIFNQVFLARLKVLDFYFNRSYHYLTDIKSGNLNRDFVAIAYVYADIDNETGASAGDAVIYANEYSNARSIVEVAKAALNDVKDAKVDNYTTEVIIDGKVKYSRYSEAQIAILKSYAK